MNSAASSCTMWPQIFATKCWKGRSKCINLSIWEYLIHPILFAFLCTFWYFCVLFGVFVYFWYFCVFFCLFVFFIFFSFCLHDLLGLALFVMPNSNRLDILSISIFFKIPFSILISIFLQWSYWYRYRYFPNLPIYQLLI